jgi:hypothetical protein
VVQNSKAVALVLVVVVVVVEQQTPTRKHPLCIERSLWRFRSLRQKTWNGIKAQVRVELLTYGRIMKAFRLL